MATPASFSLGAPDPAASAAARIVALADQCVKCGLCQPQCPTYAVAQQEAESPRGRIALARALARGELVDTQSARQHLDQCLACMRCERVCPSQVRYGELIAATRASVPARVPNPRGWDFVAAHPRLLRALLRLGAFTPLRAVLRAAALRGPWRRLGWARALAELPALPPLPASRAPRAAPTRGRVALFLGCAAAVADRDVHAAATQLLAALGYAVVVPPGQGCCGALARHDGAAATADRLGAATRAAFAAAGVDTVLVSASGCFGSLRDHALAGSGIRVREIHEFLAADTAFADLRFRPLPRRLALHTPCTQANVARGDAAVRALLERIPQLQLSAVPVAPGCCGAAGDYFLRHPDIAGTLRARTLDATLGVAPDLVATSNVGCRVWLGNGLRARGGPAIVHPVALLAAQLDN